MRPSRFLIALALVVAALSVPIGLVFDDGGPYAIMLWLALVVLAGLDLLVSPSPKKFDLGTQLPTAGFVGSQVMLSLKIIAKARALPPRLEMRLGHNENLSAPVGLILEPKAGASEITAKIPLDLRRRGAGHLTRLWLRFKSRLGLFEVLPSWPVNLDIMIAPDIAPVLNGEIQTQMLPLMDGLKSMKLRGQGSEFHQLREFSSDMDPRMIDWKRSARMRELIARETRAERNHQIMLCLDSGHLMGETIGTLSKFDLALNASLALAWAGGLGGDNVGFYSFGSRPGSYMPPRPGRTAFGLIQSQSTNLFPEDAETNHTLGLTNLNKLLSRRSLVVVFSDFADSVTVDLMVENLAVISRQHLVLYIALRDPALEQLARPDGHNMTDISLAVAARQLQNERQEVIDRLSRLGVLCLDTEPQSLTASLISRYIDIKAREMI